LPVSSISRRNFSIFCWFARMASSN
jgi:hypothetical protein